MAHVAVVAGLTVDHLVIEGKGAQFRVLGGPGLYGALGARLIAGTNVALVCELPDRDSRFVQLFSQLGIDVSHSTLVEDVATVWILNSEQGRKVVPVASTGAVELTDEAMAPPKQVGELPEGLGQGLSALLLSSPEAMPRGAGVPSILGIDPHQMRTQSSGMEYLRQFVTTGTVLLPSRVQLRHFNRDVRAAARHLSVVLGTAVIARLDAEGMYVATRAGTWSIHDDRASVVETTGAGDASAAAITAALSAGFDVVEAARFGVSVARTAISAWGPEALINADPITSPFAGIHVTTERS